MKLIIQYAILGVLALVAALGSAAIIFSAMGII